MLVIGVEGVCSSVGDCWKGLRIRSTPKCLWNLEAVGVWRMLKVSEVGVGKTLRCFWSGKQVVPWQWYHKWGSLEAWACAFLCFRACDKIVCSSGVCSSGVCSSGVCSLPFMALAITRVSISSGLLREHICCHMFPPAHVFQSGLGNTPVTKMGGISLPPQRNNPWCGWVSHKQCGYRPYCWCGRWCWHHWHLCFDQYGHTGIVGEEFPIVDWRRKGLAFLPFLDWFARSWFWIRTLLWGELLEADNRVATVGNKTIQMFGSFGLCIEYKFLLNV